MNIYGESNYDMGGNKIVNLKTPTAHTDAATAGWVRSFTSHLNNAKVEWSGAR